MRDHNSASEVMHYLRRNVHREATVTRHAPTRAGVAPFEDMQTTWEEIKRLRREMLSAPAVQTSWHRRCYAPLPEGRLSR